MSGMIQHIKAKLNVSALFNESKIGSFKAFLLLYYMIVVLY